MGRQILFFLHPTDLLQFESEIRSIEELYVVKYQLIEPSVELMDTLSDVSYRRAFLVRQKDIESVAFSLRPSKNCWMVDILKAPAVEFSAGAFCDDFLSRGRLYFNTGYYDEQGQWVNKDESFLKWGDKLLRWVRQHYEKHPRYAAYMSSHAAEWHRAGGVLRQI